MPELPEVEGVVRQLRPVAEQKTITHVQLSETIYTSKEAGKECIVKVLAPHDFERMMTGMTITDVSRRAKYIYMTLTKDGRTYLLASHLGMSGAWFDVASIEDIPDAKYQKHAHAIFTLNNGRLLVFSDIRRFGELRLLQEAADYPPLLLMAPEPFDDDACAYFIEKTTLKKYANKPIKAVIMDGHVISGCGNIYATEALYLERIRPQTITHTLSDAQKRALFAQIVRILHESIEVGGSTISDYRNVNGEAGGMQHRLKMYGKKQCACGTATESLVIGGRTSVYCPNCQQ